MSEASREIQRTMGELVGLLFERVAEVEDANAQVARESIGIVEEMLKRLDKLEAWHETNDQMVSELPHRIGALAEKRFKQIADLRVEVRMLAKETQNTRTTLETFGLELELSNP